jgi:excisionase family DNA binding protein
VSRLDSLLAELAAAIRAEVRAELADATARPPELLSIAVAAQALGISRTRLYGELTAGRLRSVKIGRRRLIPADALRKLPAVDQSMRRAAASTTATAPEEERDATAPAPPH